MDLLSDQLSDLINPLPTLIDPEDDIHIDTSAKAILVSNTREDNEENETPDISVLRRKNTQNLLDFNKRYSGIKVERKVLKDNDDSEEDESDDNRDDSASNDGEDVELYSDNIRAPMASFEELDNESESHSSADSVVDEYEYEEQVVGAREDQLNDSNDEYINQFSNIDVSDEMAKGIGLKNQLLIWDNLLECRIKLQKLLIDCNKFPQFDGLALLKTSDDNQLNACLKETSKQIQKLFKLLIEIDLTLDSQNNLLSNESQTLKSNEDIDSESVKSDEEFVENLFELKTNRGLKRKASESEYSDFLSKRHCDLVGIRTKIIDKWYEKTRFTSSALKHKSFIGLEQSSTQQINRILSDRERLVRRTQTKRSLYSIIGKSDINDKTIETNEAIDEQNVSKSGKELDSEIFDDDDFYHQLLRELIESKTGNILNDPIVLSRKWIEIQKLRNKLKRKVDTKASKGRKIRFDVHSKLVNFMAPIDTSSYSEDAKNDLFGSLFGNKFE